jgi:hypothetical protein
MALFQKRLSGNSSGKYPSETTPGSTTAYPTGLHTSENTNSTSSTRNSREFRELGKSILRPYRKMNTSGLAIESLLEYQILWDFYG